MTSRQHGGPRQPANPAATSGPGALSQRTDGGAGSAKQPLRVASGGPHGARQAAIQQQQGAPMAAGRPTAPGGAPSASPAPGGGAGAFGPSTRPNEPIMAGVPDQQQSPDTKGILRAIYNSYPSPWIATLLND